MHVLLIEPDPTECRRLLAALEGSGYAVEAAPDGLLGAARARAGTFDLLVVGTGGIEGRTLVARLRADGLVAPIVTFADGVEGQVAALDAGADDCLMRPVCLPELLARLRALGRIRRDAWIW